MNEIPLCVDLDGTLILTDTLVESLRVVVRRQRHLLLRMPFWLLRGRPYLKHKLAGHVLPDFASLPFNEPVLEYLRLQRRAGRQLILVTGADIGVARGMAAYLGGMFDEVLASDGIVNLTGRHKAALLEQRFGRHGFDYAGNERRDLAIWACARRAIVVAKNPALVSQAAELCEVEKSFLIPVGAGRFNPWS